MKFRFDDETKRFKLYFDEDADDVTDVEETEEEDVEEPDDNGKGEEKSKPKPKGEKTYTQAELDALLKQRDEDFDKKFSKKFAEYEKKKAKEVEEAAKKAQMTEAEKANQKLEELEGKLASLEQEKLITELQTSARAIFQENGVNVPDSIVNALVAEDTDTTESNVKDFILVFNKTVQAEVKKQLRASTPKTGNTGGGNGITKEDIKKIDDPEKRIQAIKDNMNLFR